MSSFIPYITSPLQIEKGKFYALPYEIERLDKQFNAILDNRGVLANHISDAMDQSSETWHDNAPAEALFGELYKIDVRESGLLRAARGVIRVAYPTPELPFVTIGSRVLCDMLGDRFLMDITGNLPLSGDEKDEENVERGSISAPVPQSLLGSKVQTSVKVNLRNRPVDVEVLDIDQNAQRNAYEIYESS